MLGFLSANIFCPETEVNSFPRAWFRDWRLLCLLSFKYFFATRTIWKLGNITRIFLSGNIHSSDAFRPISRKRKHVMDYKLRYMSADIICFERQTVFIDWQSSSNTLVFEEQMTMSKDNYPSVFKKPKTIVFIILKIFLSKHAQFWKLGSIQSHDALRLIAWERKYLTDDKSCW